MSNMSPRRRVTALPRLRGNVGGSERALRATIGPALVAWGWMVLGPARHKSGPVALMMTGPPS